MRLELNRATLVLSIAALLPSYAAMAATDFPVKPMARSPRRNGSHDWQPTTRPLP